MRMAYKQVASTLCDNVIVYLEEHNIKSQVMSIGVNAVQLKTNKVLPQSLRLALFNRKEISNLQVDNLTITMHYETSSGTSE